MNNIFKLYFTSENEEAVFKIIRDLKTLKIEKPSGVNVTVDMNETVETDYKGFVQKMYDEITRHYRDLAELETKKEKTKQVIKDEIEHWNKLKGDILKRHKDILSKHHEQLVLLVGLNEKIVLNCDNDDDRTDALYNYTYELRENVRALESDVKAYDISMSVVNNMSNKNMSLKQMNTIDTLPNSLSKNIVVGANYERHRKYVEHEIESALLRYQELGVQEIDYLKLKGHQVNTLNERLNNDKLKDSSIDDRDIDVISKKCNVSKEVAKSELLLNNCEVVATVASLLDKKLLLNVINATNKNNYIDENKKDDKSVDGLFFVISDEEMIFRIESDSDSDSVDNSESENDDYLMPINQF